MARALLALLLSVLASHIHGEEEGRRHARLRVRKTGVVDEPPRLDAIVIHRAVEEMTIAKNAKFAADGSAKDAQSYRENLLAISAAPPAEEAYDKIKPMVPETRAQLLTIRKFAALAKMHADHAQKVLFGSRHIAADAAEKAAEATKGWIKSDAAASAEKSATVGLNRGDRLAAAVAASAEPYHLALLRNQKFCEETYAKAKSANSASVRLQTAAKKIGLKAQELIAVGEGLEAQQTWGGAAGMMNEAELLRQWGEKLYGQANTACGSSGGYEMLEQQAAANTGATFIMNAPMKLPPAL